MVDPFDEWRKDELKSREIEEEDDSDDLDIDDYNDDFEY
jgi:hypothetical protein